MQAPTCDEVHQHVQAFVDAVQVALVAPHLEAFARDAFHERGEGREHVELRAIGDERQAVGHQRRRLLLDAHLERVARRHERRRLAELGRRIEVARHEEARDGILLRDRDVGRFGSGARADRLVGAGQLRSRRRRRASSTRFGEPFAGRAV